MCRRVTSRPLQLSHRRLANHTEDDHTPTMSLENAALLALVGTGLLTLLLAAQMIVDITAVAQGVAPAIRLLTSLIHLLASASVAMFFFVLHKAHYVE